MKGYNYKCVVSNKGSKRYYKRVGGKNGKWKRVSNAVGMKAEKGKKKYGVERPTQVAAPPQKQTPRKKTIQDLIGGGVFDKNILSQLNPEHTAKLSLTNTEFRGATADSRTNAKQEKLKEMIDKFGGVNEAFLYYVKLQGEEGRYAFDKEINLLLENGADMKYIKDEADKVIIKYGLDYGDLNRPWPTEGGHRVPYSDISPTKRRKMAETALGDQIARAGGGAAGAAAGAAGTELGSVALLLYSGVDVNGTRIYETDYYGVGAREPFLNIIIKKTYLDGRWDRGEKMLNPRNGKEERVWRTPEQDKIAKLLLEYGADPNGGDYYAGVLKTVLPTEIKNYARADAKDVKKKYLDMIKLLLEKGANPDSYGTKYNNHYYPIFTAVSRGLIGITRLLLEYGADPNSTWYGDRDLDTYDNATPLHIASRWGHYKIAQLLLEYGADPTAKNNKGKTPEEVAKKEGKTEIEKLMAKASEDWKTKEKEQKDAEELAQLRQKCAELAKADALRRAEEETRPGDIEAPRQ